MCTVTGGYDIFQGWYYTIQLKRLRKTMKSLNRDNIVNLYGSFVTVTATSLVYPKLLCKHNIILKTLRTSAEVRVSVLLSYSQVKIKLLAFFAYTGPLEIVRKNN